MQTALPPSCHNLKILIEAPTYIYNRLLPHAMNIMQGQLIERLISLKESKLHSFSKLIQVILQIRRNDLSRKSKTHWAIKALTASVSTLVHRKARIVSKVLSQVILQSLYGCRTSRRCWLWLDRLTGVVINWGGSAIALFLPPDALGVVFSYLFENERGQCRCEGALPSKDLTPSAAV